MTAGARVRKAERGVTATKLFCNGALFHIANTTLQIHGADGYREEYAVERHFRMHAFCPSAKAPRSVMKLLLTRIELKSRYS